ncbi:MAG: hypothetical protein KGI50_07950 [Patescibacteria group bacterium]|nr:hypothetical protein [Patescibacteria group bacterium]MDE2439093.1 hypothetical protein [Patescibacteria group bacterium]
MKYVVHRVKTIFQRLKCSFKGCRFEVITTATGSVVVRCPKCRTTAFIFKPVAWVQVQKLGDVYTAFTKTFKTATDIPRNQRIPNSYCYPLFQETGYEFSGLYMWGVTLPLYEGDSPADVKAKASSKFDGKQISGAPEK